MSIQAQEAQLREQICMICKMMYERGYIGGPAGNVSARLDDQRLLITPSIAFKQHLKPEQILIVDYKGEKSGPPSPATENLKPTSEVFMHLEIFRQRPEVNGVVHAHPTCCVALTSAGFPLKPQVLTEGIVFLGAVPTARFGTPTTQELVDSISGLVQNHDAVLLPYHGALTLGKTLLDAYSRLEVLEQVAQIQVHVEQLGGFKPLPAAEMQKILAIREKMGLSLSSDPELLKTPPAGG